jgi:hypothetical protein
MRLVRQKPHMRNELTFLCLPAENRLLLRAQTPHFCPSTGGRAPYPVLAPGPRSYSTLMRKGLTFAQHEPLLSNDLTVAFRKSARLSLMSSAWRAHFVA